MTARRDRRRRGSPEWILLGEALAARRDELDPRYHNREVFAAERGINIRLAQELEVNARENFTPLTLRDKIARPYAVTYPSIIATLRAGTDQLDAAPDTPAHHRITPRAERAGAAPLAAVPDLPALDDPPVRRFRITPELAAATEPYWIDALNRVVDAQRKLGPGDELDGGKVFPEWQEDPAAEDYARAWDTISAFTPDPREIAEFWAVWRAKRELGGRGRGGLQGRPSG